MNGLLNVTTRAHVSAEFVYSIARIHRVALSRHFSSESQSSSALSVGQETPAPKYEGKTRKKNSTFTQKLRLLRKELGSPVKHNVLSTVKGSIKRTESSHNNVLQTLHQSIIADATATAKSKKKKQKRKVERERVAELPEALREMLTSLAASGSLQSEGWKDDWGEDKLKPPSPSEDDASPDNMRRPPPHMRHPLPYIRRIEGVLEPREGGPLEDLPSPSEQKPIARLAHGLDRVLFNPGVHWLQDPRSKVYNFTPWLESIPNVKDFAFERITGFIRSSRDQDLWALAKQENRKFGGSTSSMTGMLGHVYFLISGDRDVDTSCLSKSFQREPTNFTPGQRMPSSVILNYKDGVYAIDSDSSDTSEKNILTWMGTMLEKFLTEPREEFVRYLRSSPEIPQEDIDPRREAYRYAKSDRFVLRSQLDCVDGRLPGTGVFDLKTRAALPLRLDLFNYEENSGYLIRTLQGSMESFEKEYYDLIRSAFLKYSFQARIGNMDGVLVAYHNTARLFGFQYVPLDEMDSRLFGGPGRGDRVFERCIRLLEHVADEIISTFPEQSLKCTFETKEGSHVMNVFVEPSEWHSEEPCPIVQLDVTSSSYVDDKPVRNAQAVASIDSSWLVHWTISQSSLSMEDIRSNFASAQERKFRAWNLPRGVSLTQMEEVWNNMVFNRPDGVEDEINTNTDAEKPTSTFDPTFFRSAKFNIKQLRSLSKAGRRDTLLAQSAEAGMPKIIWGQPDSFEFMTELTGGNEPLQDECVEGVSQSASQDAGIVSEDIIEKSNSADVAELPEVDLDPEDKVATMQGEGNAFTSNNDSSSASTAGIAAFDEAANLPTASEQAFIRPPQLSEHDGTEVTDVSPPSPLQDSTSESQLGQMRPSETRTVPGEGESPDILGSDSKHSL